ncbi:MAG: alpha-ketoglutarate-dependent dioxygenase AlkB [Moritella sp.]|uniref:alpha-ketoglutarate-dependent dioxygenase AlkB n=1 Tax=Moritella sp. TaxID=78556 RepID=UPI001D4F7EA2|nr:alpha-ketoglutarate-dependent dioxygenase AlkB [Moritella sp.]NQZ52154.1 alpha-ketoglutarate-dependent dioxygenase AlkB [Moritella sp.]
MKYVDYFPSYITDEDLIFGVQQELNSMKLNAPNSRKIKNFWINTTQHAYDFTGSQNPAHNFDNYPYIKQLLNQLKASGRHKFADLNACLISCYPTAKKSLGLHADNERSICQETPMCNVSIGCTRKIEFVPIKGDGRTLCSFDLEHGSLNVLNPGCNSVFKHRVPPGTHEVNGNNVRYVLSFRRFLVPGSEPLSHSPVKNNINFFENCESNKSTLSPDAAPDVTGQIPVKSDIILLAGDSHFTTLDCNRLGKDRIKVVNISEGGRKINETEKSISDFYIKNTDFNVVKLFISVGSNDIRNCRNGILHLTRPLKSLAERLKTCFPNAKIWFQSLLPLPINNSFIKNSVQEFNKLLFETCQNEKIFFHDVFNRFLGPDNHRNFYLFEKSNCHLNSVGIGRLAKTYIDLIHKNHFNPRIFNVF